MSVDSIISDFSAYVVSMPGIRHAVLSGSAMHGYATPTSDYDFLLVVDRDTEEIRAVGADKSHWDIEVRTVQWLVDFCDHLRSRPHSVLEIGYSGNYSDLRFLIRILSGAPLRIDPSVEAELAKVRERAFFWGGVYLSGAYTNLYEDLVGLWQAERLPEFQLRVGELALRGLHLTMARERLVDLSSKPAFSWLTRESQSKPLAEHWKRLLKLIFVLGMTSETAEAAMFACNGLAIGCFSNERDAHVRRRCMCVSQDLISLYLCFLAIPGLNIAQDVRTKSAFIYTEAFKFEYLLCMEAKIQNAILKNI